MTPVMEDTPAPRTFANRLVIDCRDINFRETGNAAESVLAWVMNSPNPESMHVVLPSSAPDVRKLQCTLQGMGCVVSRVTKCVSIRL